MPSALPLRYFSFHYLLLLSMTPSLLFFCLSPPPPLHVYLTLSPSQRFLKWSLVGQLRWVGVRVGVRVCFHACLSVFINSPNTLCSHACVHSVCVCVCLSTQGVCVVSSLCVWIGAYSHVYECPFSPNLFKQSKDSEDTRVHSPLFWLKTQSLRSRLLKSRKKSVNYTNPETSLDKKHDYLILTCN